ncbi:hypothetical protein AVEN_128146-1 [Araneus ventricosus]|uniref:Uncharacterized protein n=1 Tax=Araneus ventricosus TaxID=182803 RepID=A0A4Y2A1S7_ARAVE|nr:hypothetical protein AVEN_128146-1 [Araneus ventricosus]
MPHTNLILRPWWPGGKVSTSGLRAPGSKPIPPKNRRVSGAGARQIRQGQVSSRWCSAEAWRGVRQPRYRLSHPTAVQNYEDVPK